MKIGRYRRQGCYTSALAALVVLGATASTVALAGDVYWSVGVSVPAVQAGVSGSQPAYVPVYVPAQPYYGQPQPVYIHPQVIYSQPQIIYTQPQVVYTQPRPVYVQPRPDRKSVV